MRYLNAFSVFASIFMAGCFHSTELEDISKYNLRPKALANEEQVQIIAGVIGQERTSELKYYNILVAVSQQTGDTVNILMGADPGLEPMMRQFTIISARKARRTSLQAYRKKIS
jgi:hypothetical protein